ncbi:ATP-binding cassette, subfamily B [Streptomyces sp. MnatMP-M77]|uniref:ABC transporter ATP-binding protein n=1 Tax=unclassified Streptomyces TaxID=2593676 RepID=UPI0008049A86|nr:ABC transporter ATP-binding protein [Streptomyces sp. MnatMP-M77]MYT83101.1 ATP-binding cassette domain-containing protein [Streptomyces sp. SID8364]SBV03045.1 ATP-binding cassette, subfamily B [Streptomyces sp. MnatMP-M77]
MIRRLYRLWPNPKLLARLWLLTAGQAVLQGLLLALLVPVLDAVVRPRPDVGAAAPWLALGAAGAVLYAGLSVVATPVGFAAAGTLAAQLRRRLMHHVSTLTLGWFTAEHKARLARAVTSDVGSAAHLAVTIGGPVITSTLLPATVVVVTFTVDWRMALLLCAIALVAYVALRRAARIAEIAEIELERAAAGVAGRAIELGQAQPVLRAAGHTEGTPRMRAALEDHRETYREGMRRARRPFFVYTGVIMAGFIAVLALAAELMLSGRVEVARAIALLVLAARFLEPLGQLIELIGALSALRNQIARIEELLSTPPLPVPAEPVRSIADAGVEFTNVTFTYPGGDTPALEGVSLHCRPGTTTALVGPSGSGKTTATRLIARFFDIDSGELRVGGVDVRRLDPTALLDEIAIVFQDVYLFDDTIEDNLRLARPGATWDELREAASAARLDEVIERLPAGWNTRVGEGGAQLSGGERQRVAIARAMLKRARIVLVDEAGSALDPENEAAITRAIANLGSDPERTVIVIAHRPATLATADHVVALDRGRVVEAGTRAELLRTGGAFARLSSQYERARHWRIARVDG